MGILYIVATPIGNLEDISLRAVKILQSVPVIACEDTRRTGMLIKLLRNSPALRNIPSLIKGGDGVLKKFISVRDWNEAKVQNIILQELERSDVALVSDAGTPLLSDPGFKIVRAVISAGGQIIPIPGAFAGAAALSAAGLPTNKFTFLGFWSDKFEIETETTTIFYESPLRLYKTLARLAEKYPEAQVCVAKEISKIHEEFIRGNIYEVAEKFMSNKIKGEITVLVYRK